MWNDLSFEDAQSKYCWLNAFLKQLSILMGCEKSATKTEAESKWAQRAGLSDGRTLFLSSNFLCHYNSLLALIKAVIWLPSAVKGENNSSVQVHKSFLCPETTLYNQRCPASLVVHEKACYGDVTGIPVKNQMPPNLADLLEKWLFLPDAAVYSSSMINAMSLAML